LFLLIEKPAHPCAPGGDHAPADAASNDADAASHDARKRIIFAGLAKIEIAKVYQLVTTKKKTKKWWKKEKENVLYTTIQDEPARVWQAPAR
jgi:hypothetical protein